MVPSRGFITPIGEKRDERFAVHAADGRLLARHGCKVMAALHLVDLDLQQASDDEARPWSPSVTEEALGGCSGYGSPRICEICEQPVLDPDDPMDFGACRACWREHDDLIREEQR